jgi:hypothetical protein
MMTGATPMKPTLAAVLLAGAVITTAVHANDPRQITPVTCAAVFDSATVEYRRLGRGQDAQASDYLATAFEQYTIQSANSTRARIAVRKELKHAQDVEGVTVRMNGLRYLQPRIGACIGLADRLGI